MIGRSSFLYTFTKFIRITLKWIRKTTQRGEPRPVAEIQVTEPDLQYQGIVFLVLVTPSLIADSIVLFENEGVSGLRFYRNVFTRRFRIMFIKIRSSIA